MELRIAARLGAVLLLGLAATGWLAAPARAEEPILVVTGLPGGERGLTMGDLRQLGGTEITTGTPWTGAPVTFAGVTGRRVVEALQAGGAEVLADAINDYRVTIPFEAFDSDDLLIAYAVDGQPMAVRDKGPLWIVFPYDSNDRFLSDTYKAYSIWNLNRLEFR